MNGVPIIQWGMPVAPGAPPPLSQPAEASGGMPSCSVPPQPQAESQAQNQPQTEASAAKTEEKPVPPPRLDRPRVVYNPDGAGFMRGAPWRPGMPDPRAHHMLNGFVPPMHNGMLPMFVALQPPMVPPRVRPHKERHVVIEEPKGKEEAKADDEETPVPSCPCLEKKDDSSSAEEEEEVEEEQNAASPCSSSCSSSESEDSSDESSSDEKEEEEESEEDEDSDDELLLPPEVLHWCKHQLRRKYFRHMCKAYTAYYTRMTMLAEYQAIQYWYLMNASRYYYYPPQMPMYMPPQPPMMMDPHHHHHHHHHHHTPPPPPAQQPQPTPHQRVFPVPGAPFFPNGPFLVPHDHHRRPKGF